MAAYDLQTDLQRRASEAAQVWHPGALVVSIEPLTGGASSLTFVCHVEDGPAQDRRVVLKVAPPGLPAVKNRDVLRQGRIMVALHGRPGVVVPRVLFADRGEPPEVPPFVAMSHVPGESVEPVLSDSRDTARFPEIRARGLNAARVLAAIHRVDPADAGLGGEPTVSLSDEIERWTRAFATAPADLQHDFERCATALQDSVPRALRAVVNHGDYRLGNTLCAGDRVTGVIDWEIWSLGDPRIDVTWMTFFTDEAGHPASPTSDASGMPSARDLLDAYADAGGARLDDLAWFDALTRYKEAAATALLIKRARKSGTMPPSIQRMVPALPDLLSEAEHLVGR